MARNKKSAGRESKPEWPKVASLAGGFTAWLAIFIYLFSYICMTDDVGIWNVSGTVPQAIIPSRPISIWPVPTAQGIRANCFPNPAVHDV